MRKTIKKIPKQEYTAEFKEQAIKQVEMGKSIGLVAKELGLVEHTLRNWVKLAAVGKLTVAGTKVNDGMVSQETCSRIDAPLR